MEHVPIILADRHVRQLDSGRTQPHLFACSDESGNRVGEYVVKLKGHPHVRPTAMIRELIASLLARHLGLNVPKPAAVRIDDDLLEAARLTGDLTLIALIRDSLGLNFGCEVVSGGYTTWASNQPIPPLLLNRALAVFVFDLLIDNPDRRRENPNVLWNSNDIVVIDHECAFSFTDAIGGVDTPWIVKALDYHLEHVFFRPLSKTILGYDGIMKALEALSPTCWDYILSQIPSEWMCDVYEKARFNIGSKVEHAEEFIGSIKGVLA